MLTLILGGATSGKSRLAQRFARDWERVTYIATAQAAHDPEMLARIGRHRANCPSLWRTVEEPHAPASAVAKAADVSDAVLVDCLTVWISNLLLEHRPRATADAEAARQCHVTLVSNELGSGTVPDAALTGAFLDVQRLLNQWAAEAPDEVILTIAGLPLYLNAPGCHTHEKNI